MEESNLHLYSMGLIVPEYTGPTFQVLINGIHFDVGPISGPDDTLLEDLAKQHEADVLLVGFFNQSGTDFVDLEFPTLIYEYVAPPVEPTQGLQGLYGMTRMNVDYTEYLYSVSINSQSFDINDNDPSVVIDLANTESGSAFLTKFGDQTGNGNDLPVVPSQLIYEYIPVVTEPTGSVPVPTGSNWEPEYQRILDAIVSRNGTLPEASDQEFQNGVVLNLKSTGLWNKLDRFHFLGTSGDAVAALIDWKNPENTTMENNGAEFIPGEGFQGDGTGSWVNTKFNPAVDAVLYTTESCSFGGLFLNEISGPKQTELGGAHATGRTFLRTNYAGQAEMEIEGVRNGQDYVQVDSSVGWYHISRDADVTISKVNNQVSIDSSSPNDVDGPINVELPLLALWYGGGLSEFSTQKVGALYFGAALTANEMETLENIVEGLI